MFFKFFAIDFIFACDISDSITQTRKVNNMNHIVQKTESLEEFLQFLYDSDKPRKPKVPSASVVIPEAYADDFAAFCRENNCAAESAIVYSMDKMLADFGLLSRPVTPLTSSKTRKSSSLVSPKAVSLYIDKEMLEEYKSIAKSLGTSFSRLARKAIERIIVNRSN